MTAVQAARQLGITIDALYRLLWAGKLPGTYVKKSRRWMVAMKAVQARKLAKSKRVR